MILTSDLSLFPQSSCRGGNDDRQGRTSPHEPTEAGFNPCLVTSGEDDLAAGGHGVELAGQPGRSIGDVYLDQGGVGAEVAGQDIADDLRQASR